MRISLAFAAILFFSATSAQAQFPTTDQVLDRENKTTTKPSTNDPATTTSNLDLDVSSVDNIIHALYDVISGPKGSQVDLERWNNLFVEKAILAPTGKRPTGEYSIQIISPSDYMTDVFQGGVMPWDFYEIETDRTSDAFGSVTQVFSTYESRQNPADAKPFDRGINSIQLYHDGNRYWIVSVFWDRERSDQPVPEEYDG